MIKQARVALKNLAVQIPLRLDASVLIIRMSLRNLQKGRQLLYSFSCFASFSGLQVYFAFPHFFSKISWKLFSKIGVLATNFSIAFNPNLFLLKVELVQPRNMRNCISQLSKIAEKVY